MRIGKLMVASQQSRPDLEPYAERAMRWRKGFSSGQYGDPELRRVAFWPLSSGEVHYLYWFIQGSIMNVDTRWALRRGWGLCERHAWATLAVDMSFRPGYLLDPAILYEDLLDCCLARIPTFGPFKALRFVRQLRPKGPCIMCAMRIYRAAGCMPRAGLIEQGQCTDQLLGLALRYQDYWRDTVCGLCGGGGIEMVCRQHLIECSERISPDRFERVHHLLATTAARVRNLSWSFIWENRGSEAPQDSGALLTAIGWMSGWRPLLALINEPRRSSEPPHSSQRDPEIGGCGWPEVSGSLLHAIPNKDAGQ